MEDRKEANGAEIEGGESDEAGWARQYRKRGLGAGHRCVDMDIGREQWASAQL